MAMLRVLPALLLGVSVLAPGSQQEQERASREGLVAAFRELGLELDLEHGVCAVPVVVQVRDDLCEYLLTDIHGSAHETLFTTDVLPSQLNAALLALGVAPGTNARWVAKDPPPAPAELQAGASPIEVIPPDGDGFYLYVAWRSGEETFFYRVEDLVRNIASGRSMRRHRWVYLGSRMIPARPVGEGPREAFAADLERNHVSLALFASGTTLVTAALLESQAQAIWLPNAWLLPPSGARVHLYFARDRLAVPTAALAERLPVLPPEEPPADLGTGPGDGQAGPR